MYLKRLELLGFKSFPDKVILNFDDGITAIVGPNGSGKSNISDAIRWVLGEQSAKSLRGDTMEDVIFLGTENRRPVGFAQVSLVLDNENKELPIEYSEVIVTRKLFRSGESEYSINQTPCRLKDIHELFLDTGIGKEGYSIISQGKIDEILSAKSVDRRLLLEEAAGIAKFRVRRDSANRKLERQKEHLLRASDIIGEISIQIEPLKQNAAKATKFLSLAGELKELEISVFQGKITGFNQELEIHTHQNNILEAQLEQEKRMEALAVDRLSDASTSLQEKQDLVDSQRQTLINNRLLKEQKEGELRLLQQSILHTKTDITRLNNELASLTKESTDIASNKETNEKERSQGTWDVEKKEEQVQLLEKEQLEIKAQISQLDLDYKSLSHKHLSILEKDAGMEADLQVAYTEKNHALQLLENQKDMKAKDAIQSDTLQSDMAQLTLTQRELIREIADNQIPLEKITHKGLEEREKEKNTSHRLSNINKELDTSKSRLELLQDWEENNSGYNRGVQALLSHYKDNLGKESGIYGPLGALIEVNSTYEKAIEIAFGFSIQHIVCADDVAAKKAIAVLDAAKAGRATFLPMKTMQPRQLSPYEINILGEAGVVGEALSLIQYDKAFHSVLSNILGRVIILKNMDLALAFAKKTKNKYKVVTLEGELLHIGGAITGGSTQHSRSILGRANEIKALSQLTITYGHEKENLEKELELTQISVAHLLEEYQALEKNMARLQWKEKENSLLINQLSKEQAALERLHRERDNTDIQATLQALETNIHDLQADKRQYRKNIATILESIQETQGEKEQTENLFHQREEAILALQIQLSQGKEALKSLEKQIQLSEENIHESGNKKNLILAELKTKKTAIFQLEEKIHLLSEKDGEEQAENSYLENSISELKEIITNSIEQENNWKMKQKDHITIIHQLEQEQIRLESKLESITERRQLLCENMWESYEITTESMMIAVENKEENKEKKKADLAISEKRIQGLKSEIRQLGSVHVGAIEELAEQSKRLNDLSTQRDDIVEAEKKLLLIIRDLNQAMEEQFIGELEKISDSFNQVFREMFGGGKAYLSLTDPENALSSGVDIITQPPGKRLQNMQLFSGGEKALIAISLLFGIFNLKPSPFSVLDEIESALDEANVKRFSDYLTHYGKNTQFIIITHRKGTMEGADRLYGVTMQEKGISAIVSVSLEEAI